MLFLLFSYTLILHSNPVLPAVLSEIYFNDNNEWTLELCDYYGCFPGNLDYCYLISSSDTAYFNYGISFGFYDTLVVTNSDMQTDFTITKDGDVLLMMGYLGDEIAWGDYPYSHVNAPYPGQSLVRVVIDDDYPYFLLAKENQPSLGYNPFDAQTFGGIQGDVLDGGGYPVQGVQVAIISPISFSLYTNDVGHFYADSLYAMNYTLSAYKQGYTSNEITVTVEPDSTTNVTFFLYPLFADSSPQENKFSISNHPNPFYDETTIHYSLSHHAAGRITIFNSKGQKIREIPVSPTENSISWSGFDEHNKKVPSGVYFYQLESGNETSASGKMLYLK